MVRVLASGHSARMSVVLERIVFDACLQMRTLLWMSLLYMFSPRS
jgi:hypothetical protein